MSAMPPLVIQHFWPLSTYSSPSRTAVVRIDAASEPEPGSVIAKQPRPPSAIVSAKNLACSGVPARWTLRKATKVDTSVRA